MNNIKKLLKAVEVEWKMLGEVCENVSSGKNKEKLLNGKYPVFGSTGIIAYTDTYKYNFEQILVARVGANAGYVHKANGYYDVSDNTVIINVKPNFVLQYLFYLLQKMNLNTLAKGGGQPLITAGELKKLLIPIPCPDNPEKSFEIQQEIVSILDKFSTLTAELQAELQARKSQYEYYRNQLLTYPMEESDQPSLRSSRSATSIQNSDNQTQPLSTPNPHTGNSVLQPHNKVEWKTLGEIAENVSSGGTPNTGVEEYYGGNIPWLRTQEVGNGDIWDTDIKITELGLKKSSAKMIPVNCVIVAMYGATVGKVGINKIPLCTNQACANIQINEKIANYRYVYHFLLSQYEYIKSLGAGSQTNINSKIVKSLLIPVPSLEEQERIASILDKFDTITTSITEGLPKEIELRQKQYEYYRDMLLTFPTDYINE